MVTVAEADLVVSACATAVTVTVAGLGTAAGAVKTPDVEIVPVVAFPPVTPFTCQVTAVLLVFCTVAVKVCDAPVTTLAEVGEIEILTGGGGGAVMVTVAEADLVVSACETAVTVTVAGLGTAAGALKTPEVEIVPVVAFPPVTPFTCQFTAVLVVFCTVAVKVCEAPVTTLAEVGAIEILTGGGEEDEVMVTVAEADLVVSACEMAVTVTVAGLGTAAGALKTPEVEIVPVVALPPVTPFTCQVTAVLVVFCTVAVKVCDAPVAMLAVPGEIEILTGGGVEGAVMVTVAEADLVVSACEMAVTVTVAGLGTAAGAVKTPSVEIVPVVAFPPVTPFTCQVTAVLVVFCTVAVKACAAPAVTLAVPGAIEILTGGGDEGAVMVTVAEADLVASACEMAVTVTVAGLGTVAGALNTPKVEIVPVVALPPVTPFTCQVTAVLVVFCTVAANACDAPAVTVAVPGAIEILTGVGEEAEVMVTVADADLLVSACEMAVTVTVAGLGTVAGALNAPEVEIVPVVAFPPVTPFTCQVTAVLVVFCTVAVKVCDAPAVTLAVPGEIEILTGGGEEDAVMVTVAEADLLASA